VYGADEPVGGRRRAFDVPKSHGCKETGERAAVIRISLRLRLELALSTAEGARTEGVGWALAHAACCAGGEKGYVELRTPKGMSRHRRGRTPYLVSGISCLKGARTEGRRVLAGDCRL